MIPRASITAWRKAAPWPDNTQVEQDLVLRREAAQRNAGALTRAWLLARTAE